MQSVPIQMSPLLAAYALGLFRCTHGAESELHDLLLGYDPRALHRVIKVLHQWVNGPHVVGDENLARVLQRVLAPVDRALKNLTIVGTGELVRRVMNEFAVST